MKRASQFDIINGILFTLWLFLLLGNHFIEGIEPTNSDLCIIIGIAFFGIMNTTTNFFDKKD